MSTFIEKRVTRPTLDYAHEREALERRFEGVREQPLFVSVQTEFSKRKKPFTLLFEPEYASRNFSFLANQIRGEIARIVHITWKIYINKMSKEL